MAEEKKSANPTIEVSENGPYIVKDLNCLINSKGKEISSSQAMALCRCGQTSRKPFCDGTHVKAGFTGKKEDDREPDKIDVYEGEKIAIYDNRGVCSHRGHCTEELPSVWRAGQEPWIDPNGAPAEEIIKICEKCPSGALSYRVVGGEHIQEVKRRGPGIGIAPRHYDFDGGYDVTGGIKLIDPEDSIPESQEHYVLCRCGASKNKPFCDGRHWHIKFLDDNS